MKSSFIKKLMCLLLCGSSFVCLASQPEDMHEKSEELTPGATLKWSFATLPANVLGEIFLYLNHYDFPAVSRVNKNWHSASQDNHFWYVYAKKASILEEPVYQPEILYKEIVKQNPPYSFTVIDGSRDLKCINNYGYVTYIQQSQTYSGNKNGEQTVLLKALTGLDNITVRAVSRDGKVMVGESAAGEACIWTESQEIRSLGTLNNGKATGSAKAISDDGKIVAGSATDGSTDNSVGLGAFIWTGKQGMRSVQNILSAHLKLEYRFSFILWEVTSVSPSGCWLAGRGITPFNGAHFNWKASIPRRDLF